MSNRLAALSLAVFSPAVLHGEDAVQSRPITSTYALEAGFSSMADTYLTPLRYHGARLALSGRWDKMMPANPQRLSMEMNAMVETALDANPAGNANMYDLTLQYDWGMSYVWMPAPSWRVAAGGAAGFAAGVTYLPRNGNNPASAHADIMLSLRARGEWHTRLGRCPVIVADCVTLPTVGAFFSPEYGESYYEISLGNRHGLVHTGWWGNHFRIDNLLSAEFMFAKRSLTVGYRYKVDSSWVNSLNTQRVSHSLVVGVTFGAARRAMHKNMER